MDGRIRVKGSLAKEFFDDDVIEIKGHGWLEKKWTVSKSRRGSGSKSAKRTRYWYQRWREEVDGETVKRSKYIAPVRSVSSRRIRRTSVPVSDDGWDEITSV